MNRAGEMEFVLYLKLKNQKIENAPDAKKYSMIKEIELQEGDNLVGSDICKCNIYLPFEELPGVMGNIQVKTEQTIKKFFLTDYAKTEAFFLSKYRGKQMVANKPTPFRASQKLFIGDLVEMHVQMILNGDSNSMCFEEDTPEEQKEAWDLHEQESENEDAGPGEKKSELGKRDAPHSEEPERPVVTLEDIAEDKEILSKVKNPFNVEKPKVTTPKKKKARKKKVKSEEKTTLKIINYFKIIEKNTDKENTLTKKGPEAEEVGQEVPRKQLFSKKAEKKVINKEGAAPDPTKFKKGGEFMNLMADTNDLEDNLNVIRHSLKKTKQNQSMEVNEKKLQNQVLKVLLRKADIIQNNVAQKSLELVDNLKKLSSLKWWICFSNINYSKKHEELLGKLRRIPNIFIFEDFEKFINSGEETPEVQKVLIMSKFKRTYKLIVAMNKNVLPLNYGWVEDVARNQNIFSNPCNFFVEYPRDQKILPGYNKSNVVGWFKHHSHKFKINLKCSYLTRKQSICGFLENHNVIIFDKCFRGIRLENLNINRNGKDVPRRAKVRCSSGENDNTYIMRRIVETADGQVKIINNLGQLRESAEDKMVNVLVVNHFDHPELQSITKNDKLKIFSKESFLNSFLKQYLHSNEQLRCQAETQVNA